MVNVLVVFVGCAFTLCTVLKALHAEGDDVSQRTTTCCMRATTGEVSDTEVWMYNTELAQTYVLLWYSNSWFNCYLFLLPYGLGNVPTCVPL